MFKSDTGNIVFLTLHTFKYQNCEVSKNVHAIMNDFRPMFIIFLIKCCLNNTSHCLLACILFRNTYSRPLGEMVIFPIWLFPNGFIMDSPERIFISTEKCCDVLYTHSHKSYIILETASEKGPLNDIIALKKNKKIHISLDTVHAHCFMWKDK